MARPISNTNAITDSAVPAPGSTSPPYNPKWALAAKAKTAIWITRNPWMSDFMSNLL
jgi:hypothetical protein